MTQLEGEEAKDGELAFFPSERIIYTLSDKFQINPMMDELGSSSNFSFPLEDTDTSVSPQQRSYFIADRTLKNSMLIALGIN